MEWRLSQEGWNHMTKNPGLLSPQKRSSLYRNTWIGKGHVASQNHEVLRTSLFQLIFFLRSCNWNPVLLVNTFEEMHQFSPLPACIDQKQRREGSSTLGDRTRLPYCRRKPSIREWASPRGVGYTIFPDICSCAKRVHSLALLLSCKFAVGKGGA